MVNQNNTNEKLKEIRDWMESIQFQKQLIGGISEKDVWHQIMKLNSLYEEALKHEQLKYKAKLETYKEGLG